MKRGVEWGRVVRMGFLKMFLSSLAILGAFDFLWLGVLMKSFNTRQLAPIARMKDGQLDVLLAPMALAYLLMAFALAFFIGPQIAAGATKEALVRGAALGLVIYGLYDLTNLTVIRDYPLPFAVADMEWGTLLFGVAAAILSKFATN